MSDIEIKELNISVELKRKVEMICRFHHNPKCEFITCPHFCVYISILTYPFELYKNIQNSGILTSVGKLLLPILFLLVAQLPS